MEFDRRTAFRVVVAALVIAVLVTSVGWEQVVRNLRDANLALWLLVPALAALALFAGAEGTRLALDYPVRSARGSLARRAFLGAALVRNFLPGGNVGAGGFVAYTVSRHRGVDLSEAAAGVTGWEFVLMAASAAVGGTGFVGIAVAGRGTADAAELVAGFAVFLAAAAVSIAALSRFRGHAAVVAARASVAIDPLLSRVAPGYDGPVDSVDIRRGLDGFFGALGGLAADRPRFGAVVVAACAAWLCWTFALYVSLLAVGVAVSPAVVLIAVPVSGFARAVPVPAGIGPVDAALGGVIAAFTGYGVGVLASAIVLYRAGMLSVQATISGVALWSLDVVATDDVFDRD